MVLDITRLKRGRYHFMQLLVGDDYRVLWTENSQPFDSFIKDVLNLYGLDPAASEEYQILGTGHCRVDTGKSSLRKMWLITFGFRSVYGFTTDYYHLRRWSEWLTDKEILSFADIGPPSGHSINALFIKAV